MGGGGSAPPSNQTVTQTNLPTYAKPYFQDLMKRAKHESRENYKPYRQDRLAEFDPMMTQGIKATQKLYNSGTPWLDQAMPWTRQGANTYGNLADFRSDPIRTQYAQNFERVRSDDVNTGQWNQAAAQQYMNPYLNEVVARQRENMYLDYDRQRAERNARAVKAGAFGGSRQAVGDYLAEEGFNRQLADMEAQQRYAAYQNAQEMYGTDQARRLQADQSNQEKALQAALANQQRDLETRQYGADLSLKTQQADENARAEAAKIRAMAAQGLLTSGDQAAALEAQRQSINAERIKMLMAAGAQRQAYDQSLLDLHYSDYINQRDWEKQQLQFYSSILRGVPISVNSNVTQYQPYNPFQALMGAGLGGLALAQAFK